MLLRDTFYTVTLPNRTIISLREKYTEDKGDVCIVGVTFIHAAESIFKVCALSTVAVSSK